MIIQIVDWNNNIQQLTHRVTGLFGQWQFVWLDIKISGAGSILPQLFAIQGLKDLTFEHRAPKPNGGRRIVVDMSQWSTHGIGVENGRGTQAQRVCYCSYLSHTNASKKMRQPCLNCSVTVCVIGYWISKSLVLRPFDQNCLSFKDSRISTMSIARNPNGARRTWWTWARRIVVQWTNWWTSTRLLSNSEYIFTLCF